MKITYIITTDNCNSKKRCLANRNKKKPNQTDEAGIKSSGKRATLNNARE